MAKLNPRQAKFVAAYLANGGNGKQAAITAGYSPKSAEVAASKLLRVGKVAEALGNRLSKSVGPLEELADRIAKRLEQLGFADHSQAFADDGRLKPLSEIPAEVRACIKEIQLDEIWDRASETPEQIGEARKIKFQDPIAALQLLAKLRKLLVDRTEVTIKLSLEELMNAAHAKRSGS